MNGIWSMHRIASLIINRTHLVPYSRLVPRALWWSWGGGAAVSYERGNHVSSRLLLGVVKRVDQVVLTLCIN